MKLKCPACHSPNTQNIKVAYTHAQRENERGQKTISQFGVDLKPPKAAEPANEGGMAAFLWATCCFFGLWYFESIEYIFQKKILLWFVLSSSLVFLIFGMRALTYNFSKYYKYEKEWSKQYVCRRCGEVFLPEE